MIIPNATGGGNEYLEFEGGGGFLKKEKLSSELEGVCPWVFKIGGGGAFPPVLLPSFYMEQFGE